MAVTGNKKQEELVKSSQPAQSATPYSGMVGVSANTAQQVGNIQQGYKQGENVTAAQNVWNQIQAQKPGEYTSKYDGIINGILDQIQNPKEFKYEFNSDNLFKNYADLYNQYAKQGMMDAMGQAAGLTGGYGNSYAQMVGQQQYQQNMLPLYEKGLELRDRAYQNYRDDQSALLDRYNVFNQQENQDYSRYQDLLNNWRQDEGTAYNRYQDAQNFDYSQFINDRDYWTGLAQVENQAYQTEQQRQEAIRQYNQDYALRKAQFDEDVRRYNQEWEHQMALEAAAAAGGSGGGGGGGGQVYYTGGRYYLDTGNGVREISEGDAMSGRYTLYKERYDTQGRGADMDAGMKNAIASSLDYVKKQQELNKKSGK